MVSQWTLTQGTVLPRNLNWPNCWNLNWQNCCPRFLLFAIVLSTLRPVVHWHWQDLPPNPDTAVSQNSPKPILFGQKSPQLYLSFCGYNVLVLKEPLFVMHLQHLWSTNLPPRRDIWSTGFSWQSRGEAERWSGSLAMLKVEQCSMNMLKNCDNDNLITDNGWTRLNKSNSKS